MAVEAHRRAPGTLANSALLGTFTADPTFVGNTYLPAEGGLFGTIVPGTQDAVVALDGKDLAIVHAGDDVVDRRFGAFNGAHADLTNTVRVSRDGRRVAQLSERLTDHDCTETDVIRSTDGAGCALLSVYDIESGRLLLGPIVPPLGPGDVDLNGDGSLVAVAGGFDGDVAVYRVDDGTPLGVVRRAPRPEEVQLHVDTASVAFGPDGRLYAGSLAGPIDVIDPTTVTVVDQFDAPQSYSHSHIVVGADGVVLAEGDEGIVAVDSKAGSTRWEAALPAANATPCAVITMASLRGTFFCANNYGKIDERDLASGRTTGRQLDTLGSISQLAVTDDGRELLAFGEDIPVLSRWRLDGTGPITTQVARGQAVDTYGPSGAELLVADRTSVGGDAPSDQAVWDTEGDTILDPLDGFGGVWAGRRRLAGGFADGTAGVYDLERTRSGPRRRRPTR